MKRFILSTITILPTLGCLFSPQENFNTIKNVKKANSSEFEAREYQTISNDLYDVFLGNFNINLTNFYEKDVLSFNLTFTKPTSLIRAYHVFLLDGEKNLVSTLKDGTIDAVTHEYTTKVDLYQSEINELGNTYYIRIAGSDSIKRPYQMIREYIEFPLSNVKNLVMDSNYLEYVTGVSYDTRTLTINREYIKLNNIEKDIYLDLYYRFHLHDINAEFYVKSFSDVRNSKKYLYIHDPNRLYNLAFQETEEFPGYSMAATFFEITKNKTMTDFSLSNNFYVDQLTGLMSLRRGQFTNYFKTSYFLYMPFNYYKDFKDTKMIFRIKDFGAPKCNILYYFTLHYAENFISDTYTVIGEEGKKDWGGYMVEVKIWAVQLYFSHSFY